MEEQDWQVNKTQQECGKYMLDNQLQTDVNFKVGKNQQVIRANKVVLSMRSPVFDRMFNGMFKEAVEDPVIPDITPDAFNIILRYCYYDCLEVPYEVAVSTLYAAKKYMLPILENHSRNVLIQKLCVSNIWELFEHSVDIGDEKLQSGCRRYFSGNIATVREALHDSNLLTVSHNALLAFLRLNDVSDNGGLTQSGSLNYTLGICIAEIELFQACNAWAEAECLRQEIDPTGANKRTVLGECLSLIRFPTMLYEDLVNQVYPVGILTQVEKDNLCQYKHKTPDSDCQVEFPTAQRQFLTGFVDQPADLVNDRQVQFSYCNRANLVSTGFHGAVSTVCVETNERILLSKLLVKLYCQPKEVTVKDITSDRSVSMKASVQAQTYTSEDGSQVHYLDIEPPMVLNAGSKYFVTVGADKSDTQPPAIDCPSTGPLTNVKQVSLSRPSGNSYTFLKALTLSFV